MSYLTFLDQFSTQFAWETAPAKRRFQFRKQVNKGMQEQHRLALTLGGVIQRSLDDDEGLQSSDYSTYQIFEADDLVFKLIDLENIKTSRVGHVPRRGIMSPAYIRLQSRCSEIFPRFYYWFFYGAYINNIFNGMGGGVRQNLTPADLLEFPVPLPDHSTQKSIADFLDREIACIDQLIQKKQQLVALLLSRVAAFSDTIVLSGLDTAPAFQATDIPWLPKIPSHWNITRAKHLYREANRAPLPDDRIITAFRDGQVCLREKRRTEGFTFAILEVGYQHIERGDLVIHTMDAFAGAIGVSEDDGKATGEYAVCEAINSRTNNTYYAHVLRCMARRDYIYVLCPSVRERAPRFRFVRFAPIFLPVPSFEEQNDIVEAIALKTAQLQKLGSLTEQSIERLREFRAALITAAITGQIDVATWRQRDHTDRRLDQIEEEMGREEVRT